MVSAVQADEMCADGKSTDATSTQVAEPANIDALGAILYELLIGRPRRSRVPVTSWKISTRVMAGRAN